MPYQMRKEYAKSGDKFKMLVIKSIIGDVFQIPITTRGLHAAYNEGVNWCYRLGQTPASVKVVCSTGRFVTITRHGDSDKTCVSFSGLSSGYYEVTLLSGDTDYYDIVCRCDHYTLMKMVTNVNSKILYKPDETGLTPETLKQVRSFLRFNQKVRSILC